MDEWLRLLKIPEVGPRRLARLLRRFGEAGEIWRASVPELAAEAGLSLEQAEAMKDLGASLSVAQERRTIDQMGIGVVTWADSSYPPLLREIADPPAVLFVLGKPECLSAPAVGIVGTRRATGYGLGVTQRLARDLVRAGVTVVSGLAVGVDGAAHRGALEGAGISPDGEGSRGTVWQPGDKGGPGEAGTAVTERATLPAPVGERTPSLGAGPCPKRESWPKAASTSLPQSQGGSVLRPCPTVAVLGGGLDRLYPPENRRLAQVIVREGALMSEFPPGTEPEKYHFPLRNRLISGLSLGVVVVEAPEKSGALITADQALEQGRSVLAVPGQITSLASRGTNRLLQQGARVVLSWEDVLEELNLPRPDAPVEKTGETHQLNQEEWLIYQLLREGVSDTDQLVEKAGLPAGVVASLLTRLEVKNLVKKARGRVEAVQD